MGPAVGRRVAHDDHRGARGVASDESDEGGELPVRREGALEVGRRRALPGGLGPGRRARLAARPVGEAEVGDRDAWQRGRERAGDRGRRRQAGRRARLAPDGGDEQERPRLRAQPLLEAGGDGRLADAPGKVQVPLPGIEGERAAGADARHRRAAGPEERGDRARAGAEHGRAGGARLGIGRERHVERTAGGGEPREGRSSLRLSPAAEAVREHEHDAARRRRRRGRAEKAARRPGRERERDTEQAAGHWPDIRADQGGGHGLAI